MMRKRARLAVVAAIAIALMMGLVTVSAPAAEAEGHDLTGVSVKIDNTIEAPAFGFEGESPFGSKGPFNVDATIEFPLCCEGFYEVNVTGNQVSMQWIGPAEFERVLEPTTYDRYYFTFGEPILASATMNPASSMGEVTVTSPTTMTIVVGPGSDLTGPAFMLIDVGILGDEAAGGEQLAFTGVETGVLAIVGAAAVAGGAGLTMWSRRVRRNIDEAQD